MKRGATIDFYGKLMNIDREGGGYVSSGKENVMIFTPIRMELHYTTATWQKDYENTSTT